MQIKIDFTKKHFWMTLTAVLILTISVIVYAYSTNAPATFGHSAGEIMVQTSQGEKTLQEAITGGYIGSSYTLPKASDSMLGGIKVGSGLTIDGTGVLSVTAGGVINTNTSCHDVGTETRAGTGAKASQCPDGEAMVGVIQDYSIASCTGLCPFAIKCCKITLS